MTENAVDRLGVCGGVAGYRRRVARCPVDECTTEWVVSHPDSPWYGPTWQCVRCGERWIDGEHEARPFARGWRRRQQHEARALYAIATYGPAPAQDLNL